MTNSFIAIAINLVGMLVIYSLMANALVRLRWHRRGTLPVLITIIIAGLSWSAPTLVDLDLAARDANALAYSLWFGNWLVSGFGVVILCLSVRRIPRQLEDTARLDGCGWFGTYRHIVLPLVKRELGLLTFLTAMATYTLCWSALSMPGGSNQLFPPWFAWLPSIYQYSEASLARTISEMTAASIAVTLPVMLLFFFSKPYLLDPPETAGTGSIPSVS
jgi:ABC-type glycerol-3-phosphate transport system permease component